MNYIRAYILIYLGIASTIVTASELLDILNHKTPPPGIVIEIVSSNKLLLDSLLPTIKTNTKKHTAS